MPTYVYECKKCSHKFEYFQKMTDPPIETCPECGGKVRRLIGPGAGIIFKGSGYYETEYGRAANAPPCGSSGTCCGRETRCEKPPCED